MPYETKREREEREAADRRRHAQDFWAAKQKRIAEEMFRRPSTNHQL